MIGHSLSKVDWDYFKEIIRKSQIERWIISFHSPKDVFKIDEFVSAFSIEKENVFLIRM